MLRDSHGIIIQEGDAECDSGGDSAFSTGMMAFAGSTQDKQLMPLFIKNEKLVRHPFQDCWNNPGLTSRDQVIAFFAGQSTQPSVIHACLNYAKAWRVNNDILMPADKYYLYQCAFIQPPKWLKPLAYINQFLSLIWDCYVKPNHEMNQSICKNKIFGAWWFNFLKNHHPDLYGNIRDYYCGWRGKQPIYEVLCSNLELKDIEK